MSPSIPASSDISTIPSVIGTGGNPLSLNGVFFTHDTSIPANFAQPFPSLLSVQNWFGVNSPEALLAARYFAGFVGGSSLPSTLYYFQYNEAAVSGYARSGTFANIALATLQALTGNLIVTVDGAALTSAAINLASATSFSNAATLIQAGLQTAGNSFTGTGTVTNTSIVLTINSTTSGILHVGDPVVGTNIPGGTTIASFGTYTTVAGTGTVNMSLAATGAGGPEAITVTKLPTVTYDSLRAAFLITSPTTGATSSVGFATGTISAGLQLTQAAGAVLSAGLAAATPAGAANALVNSTQNWATFSAVFEATIAEAMGFAAWTSNSSPAGLERFLYVEWDTVAAEAAGPSATSFGAQVTAAAYTGSMPNYDPDPSTLYSFVTTPQQPGSTAAFIMGLVASIDFTEAQGRTSLKFRGQAGLTPTVYDLVTRANLLGNAYNFYSAVATAAQPFQYLQPGSTPGPWRWVDSYVNQIAMNADFQLSLLTLETQVKNIPYNTAGYNLVRGALSDPIAKYVNFGAIQPNIPLSASQAQQVNTAAGAKIDGVLSTVGWYLQILAASPTVRGLRGSPPMKFWYTDGGSIQSILLATIDIQ